MKATAQTLSHHNIFLNHLCRKRLSATALYNRKDKPLRSYYNHLLEAYYKKKGMQKFFRSII